MLLVFPLSIVTAVRALFSLLPYTFVLLCVGLLPDSVVLSNLSVPPWIFLFYFFFVLFSRTITACNGKATLIARAVFMFACFVHQLQFPNHLRNSTDKRGIHRLIVNFTSCVFFPQYSVFPHSFKPPPPPLLPLATTSVLLSSLFIPSSDCVFQRTLRSGHVLPPLPIRPAHI